MILNTSKNFYGVRAGSIMLVLMAMFATLLSPSLMLKAFAQTNTPGTPVVGTSHGYTQATMEPTYPIPTAGTSYTSTDGKFTIVPTRTADGTSCYIYNGITKYQWTAANGGDGGVNDGHVCLSSINQSPGDSTITYRFDWTVDASAAAESVTVNFQNTSGANVSVSTSTIATICSNDPSGRWTVSSVNSYGCVITYKAGSTYSGSWNLGYNTSYVGYGVPSYKINGVTQTLPGITVINTPLDNPYFYPNPTITINGKSYSTNYNNTKSSWVNVNGSIYAQWVISSNNVGTNITIDTSQFPAGTLINGINISQYSPTNNGGVITGFLIQVPKTSLTTQTGNFYTYLNNYTATGTYTNTTPFAGYFTPAYGQASTYKTTMPSTSYYGMTGANPTWANLTYDLSTYTDYTLSKTVPANVNNGDKFTATLNINVNNTLSIGQACDEWLASDETFDTTVTPKITFGSTVTTPTYIIQTGVRCDGTTNTAYNSVVFSGFPNPMSGNGTLTLGMIATSTTDGSFKNKSTTDTFTVWDTNMTKIGSYSASINIIFPNYNISGSSSMVSGTSSLVPSNGTYFVDNAILSNQGLPTGKSITETWTRNYTLSSCALNPKITPNGPESFGASFSYNILQTPNYGPDGLPCTPDDVSGWTISVTQSNFTLTSGQTISPNVKISFDTEPWSAVGSKITLNMTSETVTASTPVYNNGDTATKTISTTFAQNSVVGQTIQKDYDSQLIGNNVGFNLVGFNGTTTAGSGVFTFKFNDEVKQLANEQITAYNGVNLSTDVFVSNDGVNWTLWSNADQTKAYQYLQINAANMPSGWIGNVHVGFPTTLGTTQQMSGDIVGVQALQGTTTVNALGIPAIAEIDTVLHAPIMNVQKTITNPGVVKINDDGTFSIAYIIKATNTGDAAGTTAPIYDVPQLPTNFIVNSMTVDGNNVVGNSGSYSVSNGANLAANGGSQSFNVVLNGTMTNTDPAATPLSSYTSCSGGNGLINTVNMASDYDGASNNTVCSTAQFYRPAITLTKTANIPYVSQVGDTITYTLKVQNTGNDTLTNVTITDTFPGVSAVACPQTTLNKDETMTCSAIYSATMSDMTSSSKKIVNNATVTGVDPIGTTVNSSSSATVYVAIETTTPDASTVFIDTGIG